MALGFERHHEPPATRQAIPRTLGPQRRVIFGARRGKLVSFDQKGTGRLYHIEPSETRGAGGVALVGSRSRGFQARKTRAKIKKNSRDSSEAVD